MRVWTIQPLSALKDICENGTFRCDEHLSYNLSKKNSLKEQYQWLIQRMEEKIGQRPERVEYPIWSWHTWDYRRQCPERDSAAFLRRTEDKVLLTLEVPENEIVLTDFDAWQTVMSGGYLTYETDEEKLEELEAAMDRADEAELEQMIRKSWDQVFEIQTDENSEYQRGRYVQATFWEIKKEYIVEYEVLPAEPV